MIKYYTDNLCSGLYKYDSNTNIIYYFNHLKLIEQGWCISMLHCNTKNLREISHVEVFEFITKQMERSQ